MTHTIQQAYISRVLLKSAGTAITTNNNSIVQLFFSGIRSEGISSRQTTIERKCFA